MAIAQLTENGVVVNCIIIDDAAKISKDKSATQWGDEKYAAPEGQLIWMVEGAQLDWVVSGNTLVAPKTQG